MKEYADSSGNSEAMTRCVSILAKHANEKSIEAGAKQLTLANGSSGVTGTPSGPKEPEKS